MGPILSCETIENQYVTSEKNKPTVLVDGAVCALMELLAKGSTMFCRLCCKRKGVD